LLLIDPKSVELASYHDIPHLMHPVVTDMKKAPQILEWAVKKMEDRYGHMAATRTRHITQYNKLGKKKIDEWTEKIGGAPGDLPYHLPYIVIVIDELADLMMTSRKEVESHITRLAQKSRAIGIHIILATQRPSADVITGLIKSNISARISFRVFSKLDSRVILDCNGAESLQGQGDMLYLVPGTSNVVRAQGAFVSDDEITKIADFIKEQAKPQYSEELQKWGTSEMSLEDKDDLYDQAAQIVVSAQRGSVSLLQRQLKIGYTRASRLMEQLGMGGIVGDFKGSKAREVMLTAEEYEKISGDDGFDD
jgi:DNA segregation ATPase FtsK/SpoIIIE, S-DNA-T family